MEPNDPYRFTVPIVRAVFSKLILLIKTPINYIKDSPDDQIERNNQRVVKITRVPNMFITLAKKAVHLKWAAKTG